jgi:hypothetical protein
MSSVPPSERPEALYDPGRGAPGWQDPAAPPGWRGRQTPPPPVDPGPPPGAYAQPPPAYADPNYPDPAYQPTTAWPGGPDPRYRPRRPRRTGPSFITVAPALFASLAISIGVVVLFLGNLFVALGAPNGTAGRDRLLQFLAPAELATAAALVLAVALVVLQRQRGGEAPIVEARGGRVRTIALVAGGVAAVVAFAAVLRGFVYLTVPHLTGAVKVGFFINHLAVAVIAGAAAVWSLRNRW